MNKPKLSEVIHYYSKSGLKMKVVENNKIVDLTVVASDGNFECWDSEKSQIYESMDFEMKPVFEGGKIPLVELYKLAFPKIDVSEYVFKRFRESNMCDVIIPYNPDLFFGINSLGDFSLLKNGDDRMVPNQLQLFQQLIQWGFNLFGLDENEYIKKESLK